MPQSPPVLAYSGSVPMRGSTNLETDVPKSSTFPAGRAVAARLSPRRRRHAVPACAYAADELGTTIRWKPGGPSGEGLLRTALPEIDPRQHHHLRRLLELNLGDEALLHRELNRLGAP